MNFILRQIAEPILTRLGTAIAGALVGVGLATQHAVTFKQLFVVIGLLGVDLASRAILKKLPGR